MDGERGTMRSWSRAVDAYFDVRGWTGDRQSSTRRSAGDVPYVKQTDQNADDSPLWPSAADGSSGLRDKGAVAAEAVTEQALQNQDTAPYRLLTPIGTTAYGRAFRALHTQQQREVALHFLTVEDDGEGTFARALPLKVAKCAQLSHPNVIALEQLGKVESDESYYVVTEPLAGVSLEAQLDDVGTLPLSRALAITLQIGRALRAAHKLGIVHGALTPANVRLSATELSELVRVVGFGCTMLSPRAQPQRSPYQAPEIVRGQAPDARSDVFALGGLIFRMLTGRAPVPSRAGEEPTPISAYSGEPIPRELEELVARCLEADPERRACDVVALMRDLRVVARDVNVSAGNDRPILLSESSLLPPDVPLAEAEASGSIFGGESTNRRGVAWIIAGLMLALAAVWLVWEASSRARPESTPSRRAREAEKEGDDK
jgi:serine/threonine protein kinase